MDSFTQWLSHDEQQQKEAATDTAQIAQFARPVIPGYSDRFYPDPITFDDEKRKKKAKLENGKNL